MNTNSLLIWTTNSSVENFILCYGAFYYFLYITNSPFGIHTDSCCLQADARPWSLAQVHLLRGLIPLLNSRTKHLNKRSRRRSPHRRHRLGGGGAMPSNGLPYIGYKIYNKGPFAVYVAIPTPLLGGEIKVEASLEPVELELTGREEAARRLCAGGGQEGGQRHRLLRLAQPHLLLLLLLTGQLVRRVKGVDERVDAGAVSAGRHNGAIELLVVAGGRLLLGGEVGGVGVELEVPVGGVVGVDKRVEVGVYGGVVVGLLHVIVVDSLLLDGNGGGAHRSADLDGGGLLSSKGSGVESVGSGGDVVAVQDSEAVLASGILHGVGLAIVTDVAVLPHTLALGSGLLPEDDTVLLGVGGTEASVPGVESLLLQDLGVLGVNELTGGSHGQARCNDLKYRNRSDIF